MPVTPPPALPVLAAGQVATSAQLNAMASNANFLGGKPICKVASYPTGGQAISTTPIAISWTAESLDNAGMFNGLTPTYLTAQMAGWYKMRYSVVIGNTGGVFNTYMTVISGGVSSSNYLPSDTISISSLPACAAGASGLWPFYINQGDQIYLWVVGNIAGTSTASVGVGPYAFSTTLAVEFASQ